jgi:excisionase family DNA binding protein
MRIGEVADYLKVTELTICRLIGAKKILSLKVGSSWHISKADIDGWIDQHSTRTDSRTTNATETES